MCQAGGQRLQHGFHVFAARQQAAGALDFGPLPVVGLMLQRLDQRHAAALCAPLRETNHTGVDDGFSLLDRSLAAAAGHAHVFGQVVDGVEISVRQPRNFGFDVARHGQIHQQHRALAARLQCTFDCTQADERQRTRSARHHDVEAVQVLRQFGQRERLGAEPAGQRLGLVGLAHGQRHRQRLTRCKVCGDEVDHLARTDEQHVQLRQVFKDFARQAHGSSGHADGMGADLGARAHFLGHRKRALEQVVQRAAQRAGGTGFTHGRFHLAEDLRFTQHHRIQPGRHPEDMARGLFVLCHAGVFAQTLRRNLPLFAQPGQHR